MASDRWSPWQLLAAWLRDVLRLETRQSPAPSQEFASKQPSSKSLDRVSVPANLALGLEL